MKKFIAVLSALSLSAALTVGASAATLGDVNGDGAINSADALGVLQYSVGIANKSFDRENADVNGDGTINSSDALKILKVSVGLETMGKIPSTKKEVVEYYNNALKKTYAQAKRAKVTTDDSGTYSINGKVSTIESDPASVEAEFVNGKDKDGFAVSLYGPETKLTEDMLSSATVKQQGGGLKITLIIKSEKVDVKKDSVYNAAGAFPFEYSSDKTEIKSFTSGYVTYTGTVIEAVIDSSGRVTYLSIKMPYDNEFKMKNSNGKTDVIKEKGTTTYLGQFGF